MMRGLRLLINSSLRLLVNSWMMSKNISIRKRKGGGGRGGVLEGVLR
jgi:hypothetical protein